MVATSCFSEMSAARGPLVAGEAASLRLKANAGLPVEPPWGFCRARPCSCWRS